VGEQTDTLGQQKRLVGGLIARPDLLPIVQPIINGGAALDPKLRPIYLAIQATDATTDVSGLIERLGHDQADAIAHSLSESGPAAYFGDLAELGWGQRSDSIEQLARQICEAHRSRLASSILRSAASRIDLEPETLDDAVADMRDFLESPDLSAPNRYRAAAVSACDLVAQPIEKPAGILGAGTITATEYSVLYGRPGLGKSYLVLQMAIAIAEGMPFFGEPTTRSRVGVISLELATYYLRERILAICGTRTPPADVVVIPCDRLRNLLDLAAPREQEELAAWCRGEGLSMLVIDPLAIAHRGRETQEDLSPVVRFLRELPGRTGTSPMLAHHEAKPGDEPITDDLKALRGASILGDLAGTLIRLKESRGKLCMCWPKVRHGRAPEPTWLSRDPLSGVLFEVEPPEEMAAAKAGAVRAKIVAAMEPGVWYRTSDLELVTGINRRTVQRYLHILGAESRGQTNHAEWTLPVSEQETRQDAF
jgi:hypothetical protein